MIAPQIFTDVYSSFYYNSLPLPYYANSVPLRKERSRLTMQKLIIVSNRLPLSVTKDVDGLHFSESIGGLTTGLSSFFENNESLWIGWPGLTSDEITGDERQQIEDRLSEADYLPVFMTEEQMQNFYYGFCNKTIWPLFHYFHLYTSFDDIYWQSYQEVNTLFADAIAEVAEAGDTIWIQDYHFLLLPQMVRQRVPDASIGFFLHIPFPSYELFRLLPWRVELLEGLMGADLNGFHSFGYAQHFLDSARRILGHHDKLGVIQAGDRLVKADAFPMGIDYRRFADAGSIAEVKTEVEKLRAEVTDRQVIFSVDRLDYTKGIPERLIAYDHFLTQYPQYRGKVTLIQVTAPSRTGVDQYQQLKKQVDELVGDINGRHADLGWVPVWYLYQSQDFHALRALYEIADVALLTPLRDGMNLVAKEYIASKTDGRGVLVLSEMTGAASELVEALIVNPHDKQQIAEALDTALSMSVDEQARRNRAMQDRLARYDISRWAQDFMEDLAALYKPQLPLSIHPIDEQIETDLVNDYAQAERRLILLDYDGTLVSFASRPEDAVPDEALYTLLTDLAADKRNEVVLVSGRSREDLDRWLGHLDLNLVAEHGVWLRNHEREWQTIDPMENQWKEGIRPTIERFVDRTPGSLIEEKTFALAWHYRRVNSELATVRALELKETLLQLTANLNLAVLDGDKVIEVKNAGVNKGRAATRWLAQEEWGFILALGDDWTDEDTFAVLPESAYSIRVRFNPSVARFNIESSEEVRTLLTKLIGQK
jgi:trehalose 6-phosphate synthase/phosphatase